MMSFFDFLLDAWLVFLVSAILGILSGIYASTSLHVKARICFCSFFMAAFVFTTPLVDKYFEYLDYKDHYQICHSEEGKKNGYIFSENKCWKQTKTYVSVDYDTKTKEDLEIGK